MRKIRIGSRGSALAMWQANHAKSLLPNHDVEIKIIKTEGDLSDKPLSEIGGKGVFIKSLELALLNNEIDIAVHSFKDVTSDLAPGLQLSGFLKPESVRDALIVGKAPVKTIATGSLRRIQLLKKLRPELKTVDIRGNVDTRLKKLDEGQFDGLILSEAGLIRLGLNDRVTESLDPMSFVPAPGQGVICFETREGELTDLCDSISDPEQLIISRIERQLLEEIGFDCTVPLGVYSELKDDKILMRVFLNDTFSYEINLNNSDYDIKKLKEKLNGLR